MKLFLLATALLLTTAGYAQGKKHVTPPALSKSAFEKAYPGAMGKWEKEGRNYEVTFTNKGEETSCIISPAGTIIETETPIAVTGLPAKAKAYLEKHYPKQKIKDAARLVKADGSTTFEAALGKKDVIFDANGTFIKVAKD